MLIPQQVWEYGFIERSSKYFKNFRKPAQSLVLLLLPPEQVIRSFCQQKEGLKRHTQPVLTNLQWLKTPLLSYANYFSTILLLDVLSQLSPALSLEHFMPSTVNMQGSLFIFYIQNLYIHED